MEFIQTDRQTDRQTDGRTDVQTDKQTDEGQQSQKISDLTSREIICKQVLHSRQPPYIKWSFDSDVMNYAFQSIIHVLPSHYNIRMISGPIGFVKRINCLGKSLVSGYIDVDNKMLLNQYTHEVRSRRM